MPLTSFTDSYLTIKQVCDYLIGGITQKTHPSQAHFCILYVNQETKMFLFEVHLLTLYVCDDEMNHLPNCLAIKGDQSN